MNLRYIFWSDWWFSRSPELQPVISQTQWVHLWLAVGARPLPWWPEILTQHKAQHCSCVEFWVWFLATLPISALRLAFCCSCASMVRCLGRFLGIVGRGPSVSKSNRLRFTSFGIPTWIWGIFSKVIGGFPWSFELQPVLPVQCHGGPEILTRST